MGLNYVFRKTDSFYVGYLVEFPEYETQGNTLEELQEMLRSLYYDLLEFDEIHSSQPLTGD